MYDTKILMIYINNFSYDSIINKSKEWIKYKDALILLLNNNINENQSHKITKKNTDIFLEKQSHEIAKKNL